MIVSERNLLQGSKSHPLNSSLKTPYLDEAGGGDGDNHESIFLHSGIIPSALEANT